jgi:hypothetical protein
MFYIYRNLHQGQKFSIRDRGRVIERLTDFVAYDVRFKVSELGRSRVISKGQKNVHAFVVAKRYIESEFLTEDLMRITYNPYENKSFMCEGQEIHTANVVSFSGGKCYFVL